MKRLLRLSLLAAILSWIAWQPTTAQPVQNGFAAVTCYSDGVSGNPVAGLIDVRSANAQTPNQNWAAPATHGPASSPWTRANLGEVFGITFDPAGNFYLSATTVYGNSTPGGPGGNGAIYQIDGNTGGIAVFATLTNGGSGLGNIAWDDAHNQMFATNFEDGKIYRIDASGTVQNTFDPFNADGGASGPAPLGERIWGIGVYNNRVYFARWVENCGVPSSISANEIWSVALDGSGNFTGSEQLEITLPTLPGEIHSNPVSDIAFSTAGNMLLAERTVSGSGPGLYPNAHASRVLEYSGSSWSPTGNIFSIGVPGLSSGCGGYPTIGSSSAGGVDYAYTSYDPDSDQLIECDGAVWASGDALQFYNPQVIYGFQRLPASGDIVTNCVLIDADGNLSGQDKTQIGDIEVYAQCEVSTPPCDGIEVEISGGEDCCYDITLNGIPAGGFTSVSANLLTSNVTLTGVIGPAGWNVTNSGTQATWDLNNTIPGGTVTGLHFCLQSQAPPPQQIEILLHAADGTVCRFTFDLNCEPSDPQPCFVINDQEITCKGNGPNGWVYEFSFSVTNYSPFSQSPYNLPAENVVVYAPGLTITPTVTTLSPTLGYGATSGTLTYTLTSSTIQPGDNICVMVQLHGRKLKYDYQWCCPPEELCFDLPPCADCCDSVDITIDHNSGRQVGNTAATIGSGNVTVSPGPITKVQASVVSVARSRVWCPNPSTGVYAPVANPSSIGALITGGSINPSMPVSSGFSPATSEVVWGTVYSGVGFSGGSVSLNLSFPGTSLGWRCQDTLQVCVRYTFTDTACRTCDTIVCYTVPRCGRVDIADNPIDVVPASFGEVVLGEGITVGEPLYSDVVAGPGLVLSMSSASAGRLAVAHWWQDDIVGVDKVRLVRMKVTPEAGIDITRLTPQDGTEGASIVERTATISMDLRERETDNFDITFNNPTNASFFSMRVRFDYVDLDDPDVEEISREYVVYGDLTDGSPQGRIDISAADQSTPVLYKLLVASNTTNSADWIAPACFRFTPPQGVRILASGPMPDSSFAEFHVLKSMSKESSMLLQLPSPGDFRKESISQEQSVALWLVLEGGGDRFGLDWEALNMNGEVIGAGDLQLSPTSTVRDGEEYVPGASIHLLETYPNPARDRVTTRFNLARTEKVSVGLYDLSGRELSRLVDNEQLSSGSHEYDLNVKSLPSGTYYIRLTTGSGTQTRSIVKQ